MTLEVLTNVIAQLIIKRRGASDEEQARLNAKLEKLYEVKYIMLEQMARENQIYC